MMRAAEHGPVRVMFPFVSSLMEVRGAKTMIAEARAELVARGINTPELPIGIMIEVPSAAFTASILAREVDFFTIGTNDLIQYLLAVDRTDDRVSNRYQPLHPALLKLLRHIKRASRRQGDSGFVVRRDGLGPTAAARLDRMRTDRIQHDAGRAADRPPRGSGDQRRRHGQDRSAGADTGHGR
jgi:phosphoenolpyruvate synthase/pyruvate phosphate dikinase